MSAVAWPDLMRLGLVQLRLSPEAFWKLTPAELMFLASGGEVRPANMTRNALDELMALYPDKQKQGPDDGGD